MFTANFISAKVAVKLSNQKCRIKFKTNLTSNRKAKAYVLWLSCDYKLSSSQAFIIQIVFSCSAIKSLIIELVPSSLASPD